MSTENKQLIITTPSLAVVETLFPDHAKAYLDECLAEAALITEIANPADQTIASGTLSKLTGFLKQLEESRVIAKSPFKLAGEAIDNFAAQKKEKPEIEKERIKGLLGEFHLKEVRRVAREQEEKRLAEVAAQKAEEDRLAALAAQAPSFDDFFDPKYVEPAAASEPVIATAVPIYVAPVSKVKGATVKTKWTYEVSDIHALYKAHPHLVKLTANHALILGYINAGGDIDPDKNPIPGIKCSKEVNVSARAARPVVRELEG